MFDHLTVECMAPSLRDYECVVDVHAARHVKLVFQTVARLNLAAISQSSGGSTIKQLLSSGYEIKASVPNGSKFIVFMQKDKAAYACEFVTVARSRCETLN